MRPSVPARATIETFHQIDDTPIAACGQPLATAMLQMTTRPKPPRPASSVNRATILDVARRAGVSLGTVSNVVNARGNVSAAREARVQTAIAALNYVPNGVAQSLRRQRSRVVGLCAPLTSSAYFAALLDTFEDLAAAQGYEMMQVLSRQEPALELRRVSALIARKVDGLILIPSHDPFAAFDLVAAAAMPTVVVDRGYDDRRFDYVTIDDHAAMAAATTALLSRGHRRLLYVLRYPSLVTTQQRMKSFRETAAAVRGAVAEICVREPGEESFARQIAAIVRRAEAPTAIIASNSDITLALLRIFIDLGVAYPRDVSLVAFDAPPWAEVLTPPLSVVAPPVGEIARKTWDLLRARMEGEGGRRKRIALEAELIERASLAPPPAPASRRRAA